MKRKKDPSSKRPAYKKVWDIIKKWIATVVKKGQVILLQLTGAEASEASKFAKDKQALAKAKEQGVIFVFKNGELTLKAA